MKILLAEDEIPLAHALRRKFEAEEWDVDVVHTGDEAIGLIKRPAYDLVVLDMIMPSGDGHSVLKEMWRTSNEIPTVVVSNDTKILEEDSYPFILSKHIKSNTPLYKIISIIKDYAEDQKEERENIEDTQEEKQA